jgi:hypothetical protein
MVSRAEINTVYAAGLVQSIALVTFPAASTIFTDRSRYNLPNTQRHRARSAWTGTRVSAAA